MEKFLSSSQVSALLYTWCAESVCMLLADISLALCTGLPNLWITPGGTNLAPACGLYHWKSWAETFLSVTLLSVKSPFLWFCISNYFSRVHMLAFFMSLALCFRRAVVTLLIRRNLHKGISLLLQSNLLALMTSTKFLLLLFNLWRLWAILVQTGVPLLLVCENLLLINMLLLEVWKDKYRIKWQKTNIWGIYTVLNH